MKDNPLALKMSTSMRIKSAPSTKKEIRKAGIDFMNNPLLACNRIGVKVTYKAPCTGLYIDNPSKGVYPRSYGKVTSQDTPWPR